MSNAGIITRADGTMQLAKDGDEVVLNNGDRLDLPGSDQIRYVTQEAKDGRRTDDPDDRPGRRRGGG